MRVKGGGVCSWDGFVPGGSSGVMLGIRVYRWSHAGVKENRFVALCSEVGQ